MSSPRRFLGLMYRLARPLLDPLRLWRALPGYGRYFRDFARYSRMVGAEDLRWIDFYPCLGENTASHPVTTYFYQDLWAARRVVESHTAWHVDVASRLDFAGFLSLYTKVTFVDFRVPEIGLPNLECRAGDILSLPYSDGSLESVSSLSVAEHIGLGRYGDPLDPSGTRKACGELSRVLAPGGQLLFAVPVGVPRVCFNAHRIHHPRQILEYLSAVSLVEFAGIDYEGRFIEGADLDEFGRMRVATGLFRFTRLRARD